MDEDEPLNLSIKSERSHRSNPSINIWSPASLCEKESAGDSISIKEELDICKSDVALNNSSLLNSSAVSAASLLQKIQRRVNESTK